jgi:hypothetical protein
MRRFLLIAAAASIALVGLSANQCGGANEDKAEPAAPPAEPAAPPAEPAPPPVESAPPAETPSE